MANSARASLLSWPERTKARVWARTSSRLTALATDDRGRRHVQEARDVFTESALDEDLPGFFTPYAYVRYLIDKPLQLTGPITPDDLRMSERVPREDARQNV
jgi:malate synthase